MYSLTPTQIPNHLPRHQDQHPARRPPRRTSAFPPKHRLPRPQRRLRSLHPRPFQHEHALVPLPPQTPLPHPQPPPVHQLPRLPPSTPPHLLLHLRLFLRRLEPDFLLGPRSQNLCLSPLDLRAHLLLLRRHHLHHDLSRQRNPPQPRRPPRRRTLGLRPRGGHPPEETENVQSALYWRGVLSLQRGEIGQVPA